MLSRLNILTRRELAIRSCCVCERAISFRHYTTSSHKSLDNDTATVSPEEELAEDDYFWELPPAKPHLQRHRNKPVNSSLDIRTILDSLLDDRKKRDNREIIEDIIPSETLSPPSIDEDAPKSTGTGFQRRTTLIEERLKQMVLERRRVFKDKAPLPRSAMPAIYGNSNASMDAPRYDNRARLENTRQNTAIQMHDKGMKTIDTILSSSNRNDLLTTFISNVTTYQQEQQFPAYYPRLIQKTVGHAYRQFHDPYLAIALFEQCKSLSVTSYIQGCTVDVYNEVLSIRWGAWKDIYGMLDLMEEMTLNGIAFNGSSASIVQTVANEMEQQVWSNNENAEQVKLWSPDDVRSTELMKILVGKWIFK